MRVSLHRRRHESLPPQRRRSPKVLLIAIVLTTGTMAFAASHIGGKTDPVASAVESESEQATRDVVNERLHAKLKRLSQE